MLGPLASTIVLNKLYTENGGNDRKPIVIMWRLFYQIPLFKHAIRYITQVDRGLNFDEFLEKMQHDRFSRFLHYGQHQNTNVGVVALFPCS